MIRKSEHRARVPNRTVRRRIGSRMRRPENLESSSRAGRYYQSPVVSQNAIALLANCLHQIGMRFWLPTGSAQRASVHTFPPGDRGAHDIIAAPAGRVPQSEIGSAAIALERSQPKDRHDPWDSYAIRGKPTRARCDALHRGENGRNSQRRSC